MLITHRFSLPTIGSFITECCRHADDELQAANLCICGVANVRIGYVHCLKHHTFQVFHLFGVLSGFVIKAQQMQYAMEE